MSLIEDILKDREAGTAGEYWDWTTGCDAEDEDDCAMGSGWLDTTDGEPVLSYAGCGTHDTKISPADQSRIARVPQMESQILRDAEIKAAADALAASVGRSDSWFEIDAALDAYRAATGVS